MTDQLAFHGTQFNTITHNNQIWLTSKDLAKALQYATSNAVTALYNKNTDEFTAGMSQVVESTTSGNYKKKVRIFSLRGAHLIAMFARTSIAKEFRKWVLDILDKEMSEPKQKTRIPANSESDLKEDELAFLDGLEMGYLQATRLERSGDFRSVNIPNIENGRVLIEVRNGSVETRRVLPEDTLVGPVDTFTWFLDRAGYVPVRKDAMLNSDVTLKKALKKAIDSGYVAISSR